MKTLLIMMVSAILMTSATSRADDEADGVQVTYKELPAAVQQAALKFFQVRKIKEIEMKAEEDTVQYDVEGISNRGKMDITFAADGTIIQTAIRIKVDELPALAKEALLSDYPAGEVREVEKVVETSYKVEIVVNGEKREIEVKASGDIEDKNDDDGTNDIEDRQQDEDDDEEDDN